MCIRDRGDGVLFLSKLYHEGVPIRSGIRYILVGLIVREASAG